jgi:hypothetical protein
MRRVFLRPLLQLTIAALMVPIATAASQVVRDSGGIQVAENRSPGLSAARAWRIDPTPMLAIGGQQADTDTLNELNLVMGITRLRDGRYAVGVQASHAVRFYDARGKFVGFAGRKGQGPGEFQQIMGVWSTRGDTLAVLDLGEIEFFTGDGKFVTQGASRSRGYRFVYPSVFFSDGSYLGIVYRDYRTPPPAGRASHSTPIVRVSRDGLRVDTIGSWESPEEIFDGKQPWGAQVVFGGTSVVEGDDNSFFVSSPTKPEIRQYTNTGRQTRLIRLPDRGVKTPDEAIQAYRAYVMASPGEDGRPMPPAMKARFAQMLERTVYAERFPSLGAMIVDRSGNLWVQRYDYRSVFRTPGPVRTQTMAVASRWDVIDTNGRWITTVDLPARFTPVEIGADYVAGLARDEDEVEQVRIYRLRKPDSP